MKTIGIIANRNKDKDLEFTKSIINRLLEKEFSVVIPKEQEEGRDDEKAAGPLFLCDYELLFKKSEMLIILGGDGTILQIAEKAAMNNVPIMGINLGTLGYLTDVEKSEAFTALEKLLNNKYKLEKRMMLQSSLASDNKKTAAPSVEQERSSHSLALNEICIKGSLSKMIMLNLFINDEYINSYRADGILISTPTGSTAYNLSAGGPILKPDCNMIAITPICSHDLYSRPFVISGEDRIDIQVENIHAEDEEAVMSMDGRSIIPLKNKDIVKIKRSEFYTTIIKTNNLGFYDILRQKMK